MNVRLEARTTTPRWLSPTLTVGAIVVALVISGAIIAAVGGDPVASYLHILNASFGSVGVLSDTLVKATPLILTGLACALAFRMRLWNIGAEGQFLLGAWGASAVVLIPLVPAGTPGIVLIPLMMLGGLIAGGVWGLIPGILKARLGVNEIIVTLMLNYIALFWIQFWVFGPWSESGFQQTKTFPEEAWLPRLTDFSSAVPAFGGLTVHLGFVFGLAAAAIMWLLLERSRWGYEIRLIGDSPRAARYAGIDIGKRIIVVFAISGALAGLAGMSEVNGAVHRLQDHISPGYGFTAVIVAYLAKFRPGRVVVASILFGALILAGREIQPSGVPAMIQGIILFTLIVADVLVRYRVRIDRRAPASAAPATPAAPPAAPPIAPPATPPAAAPGTGG
ncbi:MAG TPA: ABC transporter permease [Candidatus Limnocylindrales bacterium]